MKEIDVIILSYAINDKYLNLNNECINSIISSTDKYKFNIYIIETEANKEFIYEQKEVMVIQPGIEFGYNKFLNIGLEYCKNEWILLSNNDVIYGKDFVDNMMIAHDKDSDILSMSPIDDTWVRQNKYDRDIPVYYGHRLQCEVTAWSILVNKKVFDIIGKFDEEFTFWYQDCDYVNNLIKYNIKHALVTSSKIRHLLSASNGLLKDWNEMVSKCESHFVNKWGQKLDELEPL